MVAGASARGRSNRRRGREFQTLIRQFFEGLGDRVFEIKAHALSGTSVDDVLLAVYDRDGRWACDLSIECKTGNVPMAQSWAQAERQARDRGAYPVLIHKRKGRADADGQWVTMSLESYVMLLEDMAGRR